jgi:hypothetical protein
MDDVTRLREALKPVEKAARGLPWAKTRPWTVRSHVGLDRGVPIIDLHDLGTRQAEQVCDAVIQQADALQTGACFLITGVGRHSTGKAVLPQVVRTRMGAACQQRGWQLRIPRAGRFTVLIDASKAPAAATGALSWLTWAWMLFVAAAAALAGLNSC